MTTYETLKIDHVVVVFEICGHFDPKRCQSWDRGTKDRKVRKTEEKKEPKKKSNLTTLTVQKHQREFESFRVNIARELSPCQT